MASADDEGAATPPDAPCDPPVPVRTDLLPGLHHLEDVAPGLLARAIVHEYAPPIPHERLARQAHVRITRDDSFPRVHQKRGEIHLPQWYLRHWHPLVVYLDLVHELVHVRQFLEGKVLFHRDADYVEWPTEIEAYRYTVLEARRLGCPDAWIRTYLEVPWVDAAGMERLYGAVGL